MESQSHYTFTAHSRKRCGEYRLLPVVPSPRINLHVPFPRDNRWIRRVLIQRPVIRPLPLLPDSPYHTVSVVDLCNPTVRIDPPFTLSTHHEVHTLFVLPEDSDNQLPVLEQLLFNNCIQEHYGQIARRMCLEQLNIYQLCNAFHIALHLLRKDNRVSQKANFVH